MTMKGTTMKKKHEKDLDASSSAASDRRAWIPPKLEELQRLTHLTLMSVIPGGGLIDNGSGSTVF